MVYLGKKEKKYICKCYKITKEDVIKKIEEGYTTYKQVKKETNLGKSCSSCKEKNKKRVKKLVKKLST